jgi:hypothetical protein
MEAASLKPEIPNPKKIQITKSQKRVNAGLNLGFEGYLEYEVRDLPAGIRASVSLLCFGFPSASTPLPV